jgi:hypothetical protein
MAPLPIPVLGGVLAGAIAFAFAVDLVKLPVFSRLKIISGLRVPSPRSLS